MEKPLEAKKILNTKVAKKTKGKEYLEYLVKWKDRLVEDSNRMDVATLQKTGYYVEDLMSRTNRCEMYYTQFHQLQLVNNLILGFTCSDSAIDM